MQKISNKLIDLIPVVIVGALVVIALGQFIGAQNELETARGECYASIGKEACER